MDAQKIRVAATPIDGGIKLTIGGTIQGNSEWLQGELDRAAKARPKVVQLDLVGVDFIASAGLGALVSFRNRIVEGGGIVHITSVNPRVLDVLKASALIKLFDVKTLSN